MRRVILAFLAATAALYLCVCAGMFMFQRSLLYFPQPRLVTDPAYTMMLPVEGATLVVTVRPRPVSKAIIYFGGNGDDVSQNLDLFARAFPEHALYLLHYRGYGGSTGNLTEEANHQDAVALYLKVREQHPDVTVMGRSLGSGVAVRLASEQAVSHLILITPYDSILNIASKRYWFVPVRLLLLDRYESFRYAEQVSAPTLIIAAALDQVVPLANTENLLRHFKSGVASMVVLDGVGHNDFESNDAYLKSIESAIN